VLVLADIANIREYRTYLTSKGVTDMIVGAFGMRLRATDTAFDILVAGRELELAAH
jgi:hypothetical protein